MTSIIFSQFFFSILLISLFGYFFYIFYPEVFFWTIIQRHNVFSFTKLTCFVFKKIDYVSKNQIQKKKHILGRTTTFTTKASDYVPKIIHFSLFTVFTDVFDLMLVLLANKIVAFSAFELQFIVHLFSLDLVCAGTNNSFHAFEAPTRLCLGILDIRFP